MYFYGHDPDAKFLLKLARYRASEACQAISELEALLSRSPARLLIDMIGFGDIQPDMALLLRSVLQTRSPTTELTTFARSSLRGNATLIWLLGDRRLIREDARIYFRHARAVADSVDNKCGWQQPVEPDLKSLFELCDEVEEEDYRCVL